MTALARTPYTALTRAPSAPLLRRPSEWMTAREVAEFLECNVHTVYDAAKAGTIPSRPHGTRGLRFPREAILALKYGAPTASDQHVRALVRQEVAAALQRVAADLMKGGAA